MSVFLWEKKKRFGVGVGAHRIQADRVSLLDVDVFFSLIEDQVIDLEKRHYLRRGSSENVKEYVFMVYMQGFTC